MALVRSSSSLSTVSPRVEVARRPGVPSRVLIGIRLKIDSSASNSPGRLMMGSERGKKPRVVETMNAGSVVSSGLVSLRTLKEDEGPMEPILEVLENKCSLEEAEKAGCRC
jgi:hypothetical protein